MTCLRVECPPKVNLYLRIVRRRDDGFHELETVLQSVGGGDTLTISTADGLTLRCDSPEVPTDERNLVLRAARALLKHYPEASERGAMFDLVKRVPIGSGMGGGSADAAGALVAVCRLWGLSPPKDELAAIAATLGSDVPFFLMGGTALAGGRGEELSAMPTAPLWLVLVRPPVSVSTPWAYGEWRADACGGPPVAEFREALAIGDPATVAGLLRNDLEPGVAAGVPEIAAARAWLLAAGALGARMTGSGSVVFGVARDEEHAREMAAAEGCPGRAWAAQCLTAGEARLVPSPCDPK